MVKIYKIIIVNLIVLLSLQASYIKGKDIFLKKCVSCHKEYIAIDKLMDNFRNHDNKLLNLKAQAFNRIEYKILRGKNQIGSIDDDIDIRKDAVLEYLTQTLYNPSDEISLASKRSRDHYVKKKSMKNQVSNEEIKYLVDFIFEYKVNHTFNKIKENANLDEKSILKNAILNNKMIIVEATSKGCHYCKKMKKEVLLLDEVKKTINKDFIFIEVNVDKSSLPFNLEKSFPNITPTFFFLDKNATLKNYYPGSWNKKDFYKLLDENKE